MDCQMTDRISFQQSLFARERLRGRWPALSKFISSSSEVEAGYGSMLQQVEGKLDITKGAAKEALDFYNRVVVDGRYINEMLEKPDAVAERLGLKISDEAKKSFQTISQAGKVGSVMNPIEVVAIAVAVTVVIVKGSDPMEEIVINESGMIRM